MFVIRVPEFQETNSGQLGKLKLLHGRSVAIFGANFSKALRPNLAEKLNSKHCEKINMKTVSLCQITVYLFKEFQIVGPNLAKRKHDKILRNRH